MTKKKNVVQKFRSFYSNLDYYDKEHLYDILAAIRGYDYSNREGEFPSEEAKRYTAGLVRSVLGFTHGLGLINSEEEIKVRSAEKVALKQFKNLPTHYRVHARKALEALRDIGEVSSDFVEDIIKAGS